MKATMEVEAVDIPTMQEMSAKEYQAYIKKHGLFFVDHHDILRSSAAEYPLATSKEQLDILIKELQAVRERLQ